MSEDNPFQELIRKVRAGDQDAARELVERYESKIRRVVRIRLDARLQRQFDSMDICQSVMASFFVRAALGQYVLETPEQVLRLLATMARNKLINQVNRQKRARRDYQRVTSSGQDQADTAIGPGEEVANREVLHEVRRRLSAAELQLLEMRDLGREWTDIAVELNSTPEALRKKLSRAINRVAGELGLAEAE